MANDNNSLAHTTWNCKYHIVFAPKYRRKIFYGGHKTEIGKILRELCDWKGIKIIEAEVCPDHIHMQVEIPPKESVAGFMGFLKGKSSILIHERHGNLKYKYGNRSDIMWIQVGRTQRRLQSTYRISLKKMNCTIN